MFELQQQSWTVATKATCGSLAAPQGCSRHCQSHDAVVHLRCFKCHMCLHLRTFLLFLCLFSLGCGWSTVSSFSCCLCLFVSMILGERDLLFHRFMHPLVDSPMCPGQHIQRTLQSPEPPEPPWPGPFLSFLIPVHSHYVETEKERKVDLCVFLRHSRVWIILLLD